MPFPPGWDGGTTKDAARTIRAHHTYANSMAACVPSVKGSSCNLERQIEWCYSERGTGQTVWLGSPAIFSPSLPHLLHCDCHVFGRK